MRRLWVTALAGFATGAVMLFGAVGEGVTTRTFSLDTSTELSAGVLDRVVVSSDGSVTLGSDVTRVVPPETVGSIWTLLELPDGSVLAGTGVDGRVYRIQRNTATLYAETGAVVVTSLTRADDGTVYAGTLPDGKLFRLNPPQNNRPQAPTLVAALPDVQHIWSVAWDATRRVVLCATGPDGKLFAVDPRLQSPNNATVLFDSEEPHLYAMAFGADHEVLLGAGGGHAVVYGVRGAGQARVIARLAGDEVKGLVAVDRDVIAISNEFTEPPEPPRRTPTASRLPTPGGPTTARPRPGRGNVYRIRPSGLAERLWNTGDTHLTSLAWDATRREALVGLGVGGRVMSVGEDRTTRVLFDVDETQVSALALTGRTRMFATADTGVVYLVGGAAPTAATWHSKVLDGAAPARWGAVRWRGDGALDWESRSGNSDTPDATWSAWEPLDADGVIHSPSSRYLQVRARFGRNASSVIRAVTVYYLPENQRAVLTDLTATPPDARPGETRASSIRLAWKVENPDSDSLRYRLRFQAEGDRGWHPLLRNQEWTTDTSLSWTTDGLPEGFYRVEVEASDEVSNPDDVVSRDRRVSEPVLVDNTAPAVTARVVNGQLQGDATDGASGVTRAEYAVDGGEWRALRATDGVFDERTEAFTAALAGVAATAGEHVVSVRAYDEAGNLGVASARYRR